MKPEIKRRWIAALRSGKYEKTRYKLKDGCCFCALGVLCDLYAKETKTEWNGELILQSRVTLPLDVMVWAGLTSADPFINSKITSYRVSHLNDEQNLSFEAIADRLEEDDCC